MNIPQRIALLIGAFVVTVVLLSTESLSVSYSSTRHWYWQAALVRCGFACVVTAAVWLALKRK